MLENALTWSYMATASQTYFNLLPLILTCFNLLQHALTYSNLLKAPPNAENEQALNHPSQESCKLFAN